MNYWPCGNPRDISDEEIYARSGGSAYPTPGTQSEEETVKDTARYLGTARARTQIGFPFKSKTAAESPSEGDGYRGSPGESGRYNGSLKPYAGDYSAYSGRPYGGSGYYNESSQAYVGDYSGHSAGSLGSIRSHNNGLPRSDDYGRDYSGYSGRTYGGSDCYSESSQTYVGDYSGHSAGSLGSSKPHNNGLPRSDDYGTGQSCLSSPERLGPEELRRRYGSPQSHVYGRPQTPIKRESGHSTQRKERGRSIGRAGEKQPSPPSRTRRGVKVNYEVESLKYQSTPLSRKREEDEEYLPRSRRSRRER